MSFTEENILRERLHELNNQFPCSYNPNDIEPLTHSKYCDFSINELFQIDKQCFHVSSLSKWIKDSNKNEDPTNRQIISIDLVKIIHEKAELLDKIKHLESRGQHSSQSLSRGSPSRIVFER